MITQYLCTVGFSKSKEFQKTEGTGKVFESIIVKRDNFRYVFFIYLFY